MLEICGQCAAALEQQGPVEQEVRGAEKHVMGLAAALEAPQQGLAQGFAR